MAFRHDRARSGWSCSVTARISARIAVALATRSSNEGDAGIDDQGRYVVRHLASEQRILDAIRPTASFAGGGY